MSGGRRSTTAASHSKLSRRHPGIVVHTTDVSAPTLDLPQVRDRSIDLAIVRVAAPPSRLPIPDDLDVEFLLNDETVVVAGQNSPWARRRKINIAELAAERWILPPPQTLNSMVVMDAFREVGAEQPIISLVTFSIQLRINLVADGSYITVLPRSMLRLYGFRLPVKVLPVELPDRELAGYDGDVEKQKLPIRSRRFSKSTFAITSNPPSANADCARPTTSGYSKSRNCADPGMAGYLEFSICQWLRNVADGINEKPNDGTEHAVLQGDNANFHAIEWKFDGQYFDLRLPILESAMQIRRGS